MFGTYLFSLLLASGSIQAGGSQVDGLKNLGSSSRIGNLIRSQSSQRGMKSLIGSLGLSNQSSASGMESSFLQSTGYLMNENVPLSDVEAVLDKQLEVVGKFKRQGSFKKTLEALLTQPLPDLVDFEQINSTEELLKKVLSKVNELLNKDKTEVEIKENIETFFVESLPMITTFIFCKPEESGSVVNDIFKDVNEEVKKIFLKFGENSENLLKIFNQRLNKLSDEAEELEQKIKDSLKFFSLNTGLNGAEMVLREVEQIFYYAQAPEAEFETLTPVVFERIGEAAFVADWAMANLSGEDSAGRLHYFGELISVLCEELRFTLSDETHTPEAITFLTELAQGMVKYAQQAPSEASQEGEVVFVDILYSLIIEIFTRVAKDTLPFSDEDPSYLSFVEVLDEKESFTQEKGEWSNPNWNPSYSQCMAFLQLLHADLLDAQNASEQLVFAMFRNIDKVFGLTNQKSLTLGQALFGLSKFSYFFDAKVSIEDIDFDKVEKLTRLGKEAATDVRLANIMEEIIMETLFKVEISPEDFGIEIDQAIDASSVSDDDKYFLKFVNGLTILRQSLVSDYSVDFSKLNPSEGIKKRMSEIWIMKDAYNALAKDSPKAIEIGEWKKHLHGFTFQTNEVEADRVEREKNKLKDVKVHLDIDGRVENIKLENHEIDQITNTLDSDCEVEVSRKKVMVAENISFLPPKFIYKNLEVTEDQLETLRLECIKAKKVEKNIVDVINGSLPEDLVQKLEESDDIIEYIQKNGVVRTQTPEGIHEYVFVKRTSHDNPCFEEEQ